MVPGLTALPLLPVKMDKGRLPAVGPGGGGALDQAQDPLRRLVAELRKKVLQCGDRIGVRRNRHTYGGTRHLAVDLAHFRCQYRTMNTQTHHAAIGPDGVHHTLAGPDDAPIRWQQHTAAAIGQGDPLPGNRPGPWRFRHGHGRQLSGCGLHHGLEGGRQIRRSIEQANRNETALLTGRNQQPPHFPAVMTGAEQGPGLPVPGVADDGMQNRPFLKNITQAAYRFKQSAPRRIVPALIPYPHFTASGPMPHSAEALRRRQSPCRPMVWRVGSCRPATLRRIFVFMAFVTIGLSLEYHQPDRDKDDRQYSNPENRSRSTHDRLHQIQGHLPTFPDLSTKQRLG